MVDPVGLFETEMRNYPFAFLHIGKPRHEEITEDAIKELYYGYNYSILYNHGFRVDEWGGPNAGFCIGTLCAECRTSFVMENVNPNPPYDYVVNDTVAQGANRADCLYWDDSSYHCDNSNFDGCWRKWRMIDTPQDSGLVECKCPIIVEPPDYGGSHPPFNWYWDEDLSDALGNLLGGLAGCSVAKQRIKVKEQVVSPYCDCYFKSNWSYESLGHLLHAVQDFWSHSNAIFVSDCKVEVCDNPSPIGCLDWECTEYNVEEKWTQPGIPDQILANGWGLFSGIFNAYGWTALHDISCAAPPTTDFPGRIILSEVPCNVGQKLIAHCMLNKDNIGGDRDCMSACDQGDWWGDCGGADNIQRDQFVAVREYAKITSKGSLLTFCDFVGPNLCYPSK
jgi:hypothetical protein